MKLLFWVSVLLLIYPYVIYPLLLRYLVRRERLAETTAMAEMAKMSAADLPCMTVIVSAHNEAAVIEEKIRSTLACDYPADRLAVVVVSDASTDATNAIVERLAAVSPNVRLLAIEEHRGKTAGLNLAMEHIDSDLVVFTDANALFDPTALRLLAECFADAEVGYAVGAALYTRNIESGAGGNEGLYWRYELAIKELESAFGSVVGGDGAIYAIRRALYEPLAAEDINDFVNPLQIIAQGYRGVFCAQARAYEDAANDYDKEFRRKRRIVCRSWGGLVRYAGRLRLQRYPRFLFMLVSHKIVRWYTVLWLVLAFATSCVLTASGRGGIYVLALCGFLGLFALAFAGWRRIRDGASAAACFSIPYYFLMSNLAALLGIVDYARGNRYITWEHVREA